MSCPGERYKKWLLHTKTQWPQRDNYADKVVRSWLDDRNLNAFHWNAPESINDSTLYDKRGDINNYIDYIASSNLIEVLKGKASVFLLDHQGAVLYLSATPDMESALAELDIRLGSVLSKGAVGTTAYSLAKEYGTTEHLYINESYIKALHPFHMICMPVSNVQDELYLMLWLDNDNEVAVLDAERILKKVAQQPSWNLNNLRLMKTVLDNCNSMIFVFDPEGSVKLKNEKAKTHSNIDGITVNDRVIFHFYELFALRAEEPKKLEKKILNKRYKLDINYHQSDSGLIIYAELHGEKVESDEWKQEIVGEFIGKDSYLDKVIKQRPKKGLRLFITGEVGTGSSYIVNYLSKELTTKEIVHIDCLAGFSRKDTDEVSKMKFIEILHKANNNILHIENVDLLANDLKTVLLKTLSSGMISSLENKSIPINIDFICSSLDDNWQSTRTNRLLFFMLSDSHIGLKTISSDLVKLQEVIHHVLMQINQKDNRELDISEQAMKILLSHDWSGNFLELFQVIENASIKCSNETITEYDIPIRINDRTKYKGMEGVKEAERCAIISSWKKNNGKLSLISNELGISRTTLWRKMKKLNLDKNSLALDNH